MSVNYTGSTAAHQSLTRPVLNPGASSWHPRRPNPHQGHYIPRNVAVWGPYGLL